MVHGVCSKAGAGSQAGVAQSEGDAGARRLHPDLSFALYPALPSRCRAQRQDWPKLLAELEVEVALVCWHRDPGRWQDQGWEMAQASPKMSGIGLSRWECPMDTARREKSGW